MMLEMHTHILIFMCLTSTYICSIAGGDCMSKLDMLTCNNMVPSTVPRGVAKVFITIDRRSDTTHFEDTMFHDISWTRVSVLDITAQYYSRKGNYKVTFEHGCFKPLARLTELRFHGDRIATFDVYALASNVHLNLLEFSSCPLLKYDFFLQTLLSADINVTIDKLTLSRTSGENSDYCKINGDFSRMIVKCGVTHINLRDSNIIIQSFTYKPERHIRLRSVDMSNVYFSFAGKNANMRSMFETFDNILNGLISLNVSGLPLERVIQAADQIVDATTITHCAQLDYKNIKFLLTNENVYADGIFKSYTLILNNTFMNISMCSVKLKTFQFRRNHLKYLNMTLYLPAQNNLTKFDFSFNEIIYFSPYVLNTATSLLSLNLDNNKFGQMQNLAEFKDLLLGLTSLKYFTIAGNGISNIPYDFFRGNSYLQVIDLSENILETLTFNLTNLYYLRELNLSFNLIHFLEGKPLENIQIYLRQNEENKLILDFTGNPTKCSCESATFIEWIITDVHPHLKQRYMCDMEGEVTEIDDDSLDHSKFLCYRDAVYVVISIGAAVILLDIFLLIIYVRKRMQMGREKDARDLFLENFLKGILQEQYLCQISYASDDEMCALDIIHPNLKHALNNHVKIERDCICLGDTHYDLGRPIVNEILRCISMSCVMIYLISDYFCQSRWCEMELREAYEKNKPLILIFKEEVPEDNMSQLLATIFNRYTRAKLVLKDGEYTLVPDWNSLCDSVIQLAADSYIENLNKNNRKNNKIQDDANHA